MHKITYGDIKTKYMPPVPAGAQIAALEFERDLLKAEIKTLQKWVEDSRQKHRAEVKELTLELARLRELLPYSVWSAL